jgi:hypothetical protein
MQISYFSFLFFLLIVLLGFQKKINAKVRDNLINNE